MDQSRSRIIPDCRKESQRAPRGPGPLEDVRGCVLCAENLRQMEGCGADAS